MSEHFMRVDFFNYGERFCPGGDIDIDPLIDFQDQLGGILETSGVGEMDGHEIALDGSHGIFFIYGSDALAMFAALEGSLRQSDMTRDALVTLRFGDADDAKEMRIDLTQGANAS